MECENRDVSRPRARLPAELLDLITQFLSSSRKDLKSLSLTSSLFLYSARRELFHTLSILFTSSGRKVSDFEQFLFHAPPQIRHFVKDLTLQGTIGSMRWRHIPLSWHPCVSKSSLMSILSYLPELKRLSFNNIALADMTTTAEAEGALERGTSHTLPLRDLDLLEFCGTSSVWATPADYLAMLAPFADIGTLIVEHCLWDDRSAIPIGASIPQTGAASIHNLAVHRLEIDNSNRTLIWLDMLARTRTVLGDIDGGEPTLREIDIVCETVREAEILGGFLSLAGSSVREIVIDLGRLFSWDGPGMLMCLVSYLS